MAANLTLLRLACYDKEDWDNDEPYIILGDGNEKYWGPVPMGEGGPPKTFNDVAPKRFNGESISIHLWEEDESNPDDHLGTVVAYASDAGHGEIAREFRRDEVYYKIWYRVDAIENGGSCSSSIVAFLVTAPTMGIISRYLLRRFGTR